MALQSWNHSSVAGYLTDYLQTRTYSTPTTSIHTTMSYKTTLIQTEWRNKVSGKKTAEGGWLLSIGYLWAFISLFLEVFLQGVNKHFLGRGGVPKKSAREKFANTCVMRVGGFSKQWMKREKLAHFAECTSVLWVIFPSPLTPVSKIIVMADPWWLSFYVRLLSANFCHQGVQNLVTLKSKLMFQSYLYEPLSVI